MYKLYKVLDDVKIYKKNNNFFVTSLGKKVIKGTNIYLEDSDNEYLRIKGYDYYLKNYKIENQEKEKIKENTIPILMYHFFYDSEVGEIKKDHNFMDKKVFYNQMKFLADNKYKTITPEELELYIDGKEKIPNNVVMITIDDSTISQYKYAYPVLKKFNLKASFSIITSRIRINDGNGYNINKKMYDEMLNSGIITFYSHSDDMHKYKDDIGIFLSQDKESSKKDLLESIDFVKNNLMFCYPFGHFNLETEEILKEVGFHMAVTVEFGKVRKGINKFRIPRIRIEETMDLNTFIEIIQI